MTLYTYAWVSTGDQDLSLQEAAFRTTSCQVIRPEKKIGTPSVWDWPSPSW